MIQRGLQDGAENVDKFGTGGNKHATLDRIEGEVKHPDTMPGFCDQGEHEPMVAALGVDKLVVCQTSNVKRKQLFVVLVVDNQRCRA